MLCRLSPLLRQPAVGRQISVLAGKTVVTSNGKHLHPMWLRERCVGPASVQWETAQPLHQPHDFPEDIDIAKARIRSAGGGRTSQLQVTFTDGHTSVFDGCALEKEAEDFAAYGIQQFDVRLPTPRPWDGSSGNPVQRAQYDEIASGKPEPMRDLTTKLLREGHVVVEGAPCEERQIVKFAKLLSGFVGDAALRPTNWGDIFNVRSNPDGAMQDLAYTSVKLPPHVDNPYRDPNPGFQILHAIENDCSTGLNLAVDGFAVAEKLRVSHPEYFEALSTVECRWENDGGDRSTALVHFAPHLAVSHATGQLTQIRYSPKSGGYTPALSDYKRMETFYKARRCLAEMLNDEANTVHFKLEKGSMWIFNNLRVLHGRGEFDPSEGKRFLQGAYIDMDAVTSAYFRAKYACREEKAKEERAAIEAMEERSKELPSMVEHQVSGGQLFA